MVMSPTNGHGNNDNPLQRMIQRALRAARFTPRQQLLIQQIRGLPDEIPMAPEPGSTIGEPPEEFVSILRLPAGGQHPLTVHIDGEDIRLVLNSRGESNPERETFLWRWLLQRVRQETR